MDLYKDMYIYICIYIYVCMCRKPLSCVFVMSNNVVRQCGTPSPLSERALYFVLVEKAESWFVIHPLPLETDLNCPWELIQTFPRN
jgi:hypothetical protein